MKTIVILGGGVGGIVTANKLRRLMPSENNIIVIEKDRIHSFAPSFLWLMTGKRRKDQISRDISLLISKNIDIRNEEVISINPEEKFVETGKEKIYFDFLVIALGAELYPEAIPGLSSNSLDYYSFDGAQKLHDVLQKFDSGKIAVVVASLPYKCPAAPYEGAMLISDFFKRKGIRQKIDIDLFTPEPAPMPVAGPALGEAVKQVLGTRKINYYPLHKLISVEPDHKELQFEGKSPISYDLLVVIPPHRSPKVIQSSKLAGQSGWIPVDQSTLQTNFESVFAIGDVTSITIPGRWKPDVSMILPKAGIFAHLQAEVVAQRIADKLKGKKSESQFCGEGFCMLEAGEDVAGFAYGNFYGEPAPDVKLRKTGTTWHWGKILFEKWWLAPLGLKKTLTRTALNFGAKILRIPVRV